YCCSPYWLSGLDPGDCSRRLAIRPFPEWLLRGCGRYACAGPTYDGGHFVRRRLSLRVKSAHRTGRRASWAATCWGRLGTKRVDGYAAAESYWWIAVVGVWGSLNRCGIGTRRTCQDSGAMEAATGLAREP